MLNRRIQDFILKSTLFSGKISASAGQRTKYLAALQHSLDIHLLLGSAFKKAINVIFTDVSAKVVGDKIGQQYFSDVINCLTKTPNPLPAVDRLNKFLGQDQQIVVIPREELDERITTDRISLASRRTGVSLIAP